MTAFSTKDDERDLQVQGKAHIPNTYMKLGDPFPMAYLVHHPCLKCHPSPLGHGWKLVGGRCRPVCHTRSALPMHLPAPGPAAESEEDESEDDDDDNDKDLQMQRGFHQSLTIQRLSGPI